jgi:hypothetical protein
MTSGIQPTTTHRRTHGAVYAAIIGGVVGAIVGALITPLVPPLYGAVTGVFRPGGCPGVAETSQDPGLRKQHCAPLALSNGWVDLDDEDLGKWSHSGTPTASQDINQADLVQRDAGLEAGSGANGSPGVLVYLSHTKPLSYVDCTMQMAAAPAQRILLRDLHPGDGICVFTSERRWAVMRIDTVTLNSGTTTFHVAVWQKNR